MMSIHALDNAVACHSQGAFSAVAETLRSCEIGYSRALFQLSAMSADDAHSRHGNSQRFAAYADVIWD